MRTGEFGLPPGCSVTFALEAVDILARLAQIGARSALEEFCRSYANEEGHRPTAMQAWRAGHNPAAARSAHNGWFGLLGHLGLLNDEEAELWRANGEVLSGFEAEPISKAYKLLTLQALLQDQTLRSGSPITQLAWTAHRLVAADPRLVADARSETAMPNPIGADEASWRDYWRRWPLAAWTGALRGRPGRWFRVDGERFVPTFQVAGGLGATFDAMVAEIVDWRLARYLFAKQSDDAPAIQLRLGQSNGRPLLWLDREHDPGLPTGETRFTAEYDVYFGNFVKVALNTAHLQGSRTNDLHALLRRWFGESAGQPGTDHRVELRRTTVGWMLQPVRHLVSGDKATDATA